jgi:hypothetical protein
MKGIQTTIASKAPKSHGQETMDLFRLSDNLRSRFVFVDVKKLDQNVVQKIIERFHIYCVADLREFPVFKEPHFKHHAVIDYFSRRGVIYIPVMEILNYKDSNIRKFYTFNAAAKLRQQGVLLLLFDGDVSEDLIRDSRRRLSRSGNMLELNPRALHPSLR